jgi:sugar phosphate isomerase/epimerase
VGFKLGYSTYALKMIDPFEAVQMIKDTGYEFLELCLSEDCITSPASFSIDKQIDLRRLCEDSGFPSPIFFGDIDVCANASDMVSMLELTKKKFEMAHQIHFDYSKVMMTTTPGRSAPPWESGKERIRDAFHSIADLALENDVMLAVEAHAGTDFETPEKVVWLIDQISHPNLQIDLDISHFAVEGSRIGHSVKLCAPHTVMVHIKDGEKKGNDVQFALPGSGNIDVAEFLEALRLNGLEEIPVYAEVSIQQSSRKDYDPLETAEFCFNVLDNARKKLESFN